VLHVRFQTAAAFACLGLLGFVVHGVQLLGMVKRLASGSEFEAAVTVDGVHA
jgi:xanthosine utilization system XapX-like protein